MKVSGFMAKQYASPSGWFGRVFTASILNRANAAKNQAVFAALDIDANSRVLEVGFGGGGLIFNIARKTVCAEIIGVEQSEAMLKRGIAKARRNRNLRRVKLQWGDMERLDFEDNRFNRICSVNTVYFWNDLSRSCHELSRVAHASAKVVLGFSAGESLIEAGYADHGFTFHPPELIHQSMADVDLVLEKVDQIERPKKDPFLIATYIKNVY